MNEREVEHLARAAFALLRFGGPETDPGTVLVRYGTPVAVRAVSEGKGLRTEFWDYGQGPDVAFQRISGKMDLTPEARAYLDELLQSFPHQYGAESRAVFPLAAQTARFRTEPGGEVEIHTSVPGTLATGPADSLELGVFLVAPGQSPREVRRRRVPAEVAKLNLRIPVAAGSGRVVVELYHPGLGQAASLSAPAFRGDGEDERLSDLLLVYPAEPDRERISRTDPTLVAHTGPGGVAPDSLGVLFEIYGLRRPGDEYRLWAEIQPGTSRERIRLPIRPAGQARFAPQWAMRPAAQRAPFPEYLTLDLSGTGAGEHRLHLFLELPGGELVHEKLDLTVEREANTLQRGLEGARAPSR